MGKFDGILICTDLDGTLFRKDKTVSKENREAIEYFKREGGYFTFITGRMPQYSHSAYEAALPNVPFGAMNGGALYDGAKKEYVWTFPMAEDPTELIEMIDRSFPNVGIQISTFGRTYFVKENDTMFRFRQITGLPNLVADYHDVRENVGKVLFGIDSEEDLLGIKRMLLEHPKAHLFDFIRSQKNLFEILPKGVHKVLALIKLADLLGVDHRRTVAVGDYDNDVGMFKSSGVGIAVSNASPTARRAADLFTVSNEEHAIARIIYDIESGAIPL